MFRKIMLFLLAAFLVIQFFHPKKNKAEGPQPNYIGNNYAIPDDVKAILGKACNDCHSNNTHYPWYAKIQPVHWWMNKHINEGKRGLNFDEYTSRRIFFQYKKMDDVIEVIKENEMPLDSYTWIHKDAILTQAEKDKLISWASAVRDSIKSRYPADSLTRPKK